MNKSALVIVLLTLCIILPSRSQYVIQVPYVFIDLYSGNPSVGETYFSIPRPDATYQSVRLRGLSEGLRGLVRDAYSDHFRNPANPASDIPIELFGDVGSVNDNGKFLFGSVLNSETNSLTGFVTLEQLMKNTSQSDITTAGSPYSSPYTSSSTQENSPRNIGARLSYSGTTKQNIALGLSYEYSAPKLDEKSESIQQYSPPSPQTSRNLRDNSRDGKIHRVSAGIVIPMENAKMEVSATGLFTNHTLKEYYENSSFSQYSSYTNKYSYPTDISSSGSLLEVVYASGVPEESARRFLAHLGYTAFDATGSSSSEYRSSYGSYNATASTRSATGSIIDVKAGVGLEKKISEQFSGYIAFSVNYIRNKSTGSENGTVRDSAFSFDSTRTFSKSLSDKKEGFDVRIPLAVEYFISEHVTFRAGLEPRYRFGETRTEQTEFPPYYYPYTISTNKVKVEAKGLSLSTNVGVSAYHVDYGQIDLLFGNVLTETKFWSVAIRYLL
jgi:hypothetical protein